MATPQQAVRIKFKFIGLHLDILTCFYRRDSHATLEDYIELSGGQPTIETINKRYACARYPFVPEEEIVTSGVRPFEITYSASGEVGKMNKGFVLEYQVMDVGCGGTYFTDGEAKAVTSPGYPDSYLSHMYCVYYLSVPEVS